MTWTTVHRCIVLGLLTGCFVVLVSLHREQRTAHFQLAQINATQALLLAQRTALTQEVR